MKKREKVKKMRWDLVLFFIVLAFLIGIKFFDNALTGNIVLNGDDYIGTDFAPPFDVFNSNTLIFNVSPEYLSVGSETAILNVTVDQIGGFIYRTGYYYNINTSQWIPFTFPQTTIGNSSWIYSHAFTELSIPNENLSNGNNLIATYSCKKILDNWECGCQDSDQSDCRRWMLQIFNSNGENSIPNTDSNSIRIHNCTDLQNINNNLTASYVLANDIDCSETRTWNYNSIPGVYEGFIPLSRGFIGVLDGKGYVIKNLYMNYSYNPNPGNYYTIYNNAAGLFESLRGGTIKNLGMANAYIEGGWWVGLLAGSLYYNPSPQVKVFNSYFTGTVIGHGYAVGGLIGSATGGYGYDFYANNHTPIFPINNVYVVANSASGVSNYGGFYGVCPSCNTPVTNASYFDKTVFSFDSSGKTTSEMKQQSTYVGWDFTNTWAINSGINNGYPYLRSGGSQPSGTNSSVINIYTCMDLQNMNNNLNASYVLANDIDCSDTRNWVYTYQSAVIINGSRILVNYSGFGFNPIASQPNYTVNASGVVVSTSPLYFTGKLDGKYYTIRGLFINRTSASGLFSRVKGATIQNVILSNLNYLCGDYCGGLVGSLSTSGVIQNVFTSGIISGKSYLGGIVGSMSTNTNEVFVNSAISFTNISGFMYIGGLVGSNGYALINNSYSRGSVSGDANIGGIVGTSTGGRIANSYSTSLVNGRVSISPWVGDYQLGGKTSNSFAVSFVNNLCALSGCNPIGPTPDNIENFYYLKNDSGGPSRCNIYLIGGVYYFDDAGCTRIQNNLSYFKDKNNAPMNTWDFTNTWAIDPSYNDGYPYLKWER